VSHDRLLAATGRHGTQTERRPLALADLAASDLMDGPVAVCELAAAPESAKAARDFTGSTLQRWGLEIDTAELVVSELVTNALRHGMLSAPRMLGEHPVALRLLCNAPYLICMVTDPGRTGPVRVDTSASAECGRGLQVVEACSVQWGWGPLGDGPNGSWPASAGKVVWALLHSAELQRAADWSRWLSRRSARGPAAPVKRAGRRTRHPWHPGGTRRSRPACRQAQGRQDAGSSGVR
jgi:anti-sigma regulatory factor (Ser/Thr protein kinase)